MQPYVVHLTARLYADSTAHARLLVREALEAALIHPQQFIISPDRRADERGNPPDCPAALLGSEKVPERPFERLLRATVVDPTADLEVSERLAQRFEALGWRQAEESPHGWAFTKEIADAG